MQKSHFLRNHRLAFFSNLNNQLISNAQIFLARSLVRLSIPINGLGIRLHHRDMLLIRFYLQKSRMDLVQDSRDQHPFCLWSPRRIRNATQQQRHNRCHACTRNNSIPQIPHAHATSLNDGDAPSRSWVVAPRLSKTPPLAALLRDPPALSDCTVPSPFALPRLAAANAE